MATLYKNALEWKLNFKQIAVRDEASKLRSLASDLCDPSRKEIERWAAEYNAKLPDAISAAKAGLKTEIVLTLRPASPDLTEYSAEMNRVLELISSGKIAPELRSPIEDCTKIAQKRTVSKPPISYPGQSRA